MIRQEQLDQINLWKIIEAYRLPHVFIAHIPNGQYRDIKTAVLLKEMGVVAGVPDFLFIANMKVGFLELKIKKGKLSDNQLDFISVAASNGVHVDVAYSIKEAVEMLQVRGVIDPRVKVLKEG